MASGFSQTGQPYWRPVSAATSRLRVTTPASATRSLAARAGSTLRRACPPTPQIATRTAALSLIQRSVAGGEPHDRCERDGSEERAERGPQDRRGGERREPEELDGQHHPGRAAVVAPHAGEILVGMAAVGAPPLLRPAQAD